MLPINYIVQPYAYSIFESIGPIVPVYESWGGLLVRYYVPLTTSVICVVYSGLAIRWFLLRRLQFQSILTTSKSGLNVQRYVRLILLALVHSALLIANDLVAIVMVYKYTPLSPYTSWDSVHANFSVPSQFPQDFYVGSQSPLMSALVFRTYAPAGYSIIFFIFFGLGEDAIGDYIRIGRGISDRLRRAGSRTLLTRKPVHLQPIRIPKLGSTVVPAGEQIFAQQTGSSMKDNYNNEDEKTEDRFGRLRGRGIPVVVETSIV